MWWWLCNFRKEKVKKSMEENWVYNNKGKCSGSGSGSGSRRRRGGMKKSENNEDFDEEEVWEVVRGGKWNKDQRMMIPRSSTNEVNNNNDKDVVQPLHQHQSSSAPINIPDWSKIYGKMGHGHDHDDGSTTGGSYINKNIDDDDDYDMVPPHEWLARRLARTHISSSSMCEGIGRTLKGRDLSQVRNAVLTKTGFLE